MTARHRADAAHPVPSVWAQPRIVVPPKHLASHVHEFITVAVFEGLRESIAQCPGCGETRTVFRTGVEA